jgi:transcription elongation GreA/GreB family factor
MMFDKKKVFEAFEMALTEKISNLVEEALAQKEAATNEESKAENKYDTRGLEASYIAQAHAKRIQEMKEALFQLKKTPRDPFNNKIKVGDLIEVLESDTKKEQIFFMLPTGGIEITLERKKIRSLSAASPLGGKLLGASIGDEVSLNKKNYEIINAL